MGHLCTHMRNTLIVVQNFCVESSCKMVKEWGSMINMCLRNVNSE
jgi:hypothetical protein